MMRWTYLVAFALGCGHPAATPTTTPIAPVTPVDAAPTAPPLDEDLPALALRAVKMYQDWEHAFSETGKDCAAATTKMNALAGANADLIAANARLAKAGHEKIKAARAELDKHSAEIDGSAKAIMQGPTMTACSSDAAFSKALDRLAGE